MQQKLTFIVLIAIISAIQCEKLIMTVAFCPTLGPVTGALVEVDPTSGALKLLKMFPWPPQIVPVGCVDTHSLQPTISFDYQTSYGEMVTLSLIDGTTSYVKATNPRTSAFYNMVYVGQNKLRGLTTTSGSATGPAWCNRGCFAYVEFDLLTGNTTRLSLLPFANVLPNTHAYDPKTNTLWVQASNDLRPSNESCARKAKDVCLLNIDATTGKLRSAVLSADWRAYQYGPVRKGNTALTFAQGSYCNNAMFSTINLDTATATILSCLSVKPTQTPWISSFSQDGSLLATATGNYWSNSKLLVLNTGTGAANVDLSINKLAKYLNAEDKIFSVWSINFIAS